MTTYFTTYYYLLYYFTEMLAYFYKSNAICIKYQSCCQCQIHNIVQTDHCQGLLREAAAGLNVASSLQPLEWVNCTVWRGEQRQCFNFGHTKTDGFANPFPLPRYLSLFLSKIEAYPHLSKVLRWTCWVSTLTDPIHFPYTVHHAYCSGCVEVLGILSKW